MAKTKEKDALIEQLLKKVEEKKKLIDKIKNPDFKTNLSFSFEMFGSPNRINLNTASEELLLSLLVYLDTLAVKRGLIEVEYGITFKDKWYGFALEDWRDDIVLKLRQKQSQVQVAELKAIELKLNELISEDKKKDIVLDNIKNLLGD